MGCRTGFYLITRGVSNEKVLEVTMDVLLKIISHEGEVFGASRVECGNYLDLDLSTAKRECEKYLRVLESKENDFKYRA
jgi:S-ribosylhomocysteine lyase